MTCDRWQVVVVPFPFVDSPQSKRRPALVLSGASFNQHGHTILALITTKADPAWPGDVEIQDLTAAGLPRACIVRPKIFTLDNRLLIKRIGRLKATDRTAVDQALQEILAE